MINDFAGLTKIHELMNDELLGFLSWSIMYTVHSKMLSFSSV